MNSKDDFSQFKKGLYRHYKGNDYKVLDVVKHSETGEWMVLYQACYGEGFSWVRPISLFFDNAVNSAGQTVPRFLFISD